MRRSNDNIKEFKNGNLHICFDRFTREEIQAGHTSEIEVLSYTLDSLDCYLIGEQFCLSNYDSGVLVYNLNFDKCYILSFGCLYNSIDSGKTLKLTAFTPDNDQREQIDRYFE